MHIFKNIRVYGFKKVIQVKVKIEIQILSKCCNFTPMYIIKYFRLFALLIGLCSSAMAQDAVIIKAGDVARGLIKGTDFNQVAFEQEGGQVKIYAAKDIEGFVWNGETYWSKPMLIANKLTHKFYKEIEAGKINLYTTGMILKEAPMPVRQKVKPQIGIGLGTGGMGTGISIGSGSRQNLPQERIPTPTEQKIRFFIEKPGTGPMLELNFDFPASVKAQLGLKVQDQQGIFDALKELNQISPEQLLLIIQKYNAAASPKEPN
ncbi:MAG: hypothetical protein EOO99_07890 [Pedobacter sp.]|nr:MAG: hypothetical protein EOO99_07890 [Pedobacter sp.]